MRPMPTLLSNLSLQATAGARAAIGYIHVACDNLRAAGTKAVAHAIKPAAGLFAEGFVGAHEKPSKCKAGNGTSLRHNGFFVVFSGGRRG